MLAGLGLALLVVWLGVDLGVGKGRQRRTARPMQAQRVASRTSPLTAEHPNWSAALRRALAESPPFGVEQPEAAMPGDGLCRLLERLARQDPTSALAIVAAVADDATVRHKMASIVVRTWAADDPAAAWAWACAASEAWSCRDRPPLRCAALLGMAARAPDYLVTVVTARAIAIDDFDLLIPATAALLHAGQARRAEEAVSAWSRDLPPGTVGPVVVALMVNELSRRTPAEALAWLETLPPSANRYDGEAVLAARWAETAPRDAVSWAAALPSPQARDAALEVAFYGWSDRDPDAAIDWLAQNPGEPTRDELIRNLVSRPAFRAANPRQAVQLAEAIHDESAREHALESAMLTWSGFDRSAALRYARDASGITEAHRAELLRRLQQHADFPSY